jgi:hypothetical protein
VSYRTGNPSRRTLVLLVVVGLLVAVFGLTVVRSSLATPEGWVVVQGHIVDYRERSDVDGSTYAPVVEYRDAAGAAHRVESSVSSSFRDSLGTETSVAYDPADPARARVVGGVTAIVWIIAVVFGLFFAFVPGIILLGSLRRPSGDGPSDGYVVHDEATDRERFERAGSQVVLQLVLPTVGGLAFLGFGVWLFGQGFPLLLASLVFGYFGVYMLLGGAAALRRGFDPTLIEVGRDGVWLPGLGRRPWSDFSDVRLEMYSGPAGSPNRRRRRTVPVATYRRLGFVPGDVSLAAARPFVERLATAMGMLYYRLFIPLVGIRSPDLAPFGVQEYELGHDAFERLLVTVGAHREVGSVAETPGVMPANVLSRVPRDGDERQGDDDDVPGMTVSGGGGLGPILNAVLFFLPTRYRAAVGYAQVGFFGGLILAVLLPTMLATTGVSPMPLFIVGFLAIAGAVLVVPVVRAARRARARGTGIAAIAVPLLVGALIGAVLPSAVGAGPRSGPAASAPTSSPSAPAPGQYRVLELRGSVPAGVSTAVMAVSVNEDPATARAEDLTVYELGYAEAGSGANLVPNGSLRGDTDALAGWEYSGDGDLSLAASDLGPGRMLRFVAASTERLALNSAPFGVTPGGDYRIWIAVRVPSTSGSSYAAVIFLAGSEVARQVLPLTP